MDLLALLSVLKDGLLCRSEAAALTWDDVERRENGSELINVRRTKTDPEAEGVTLYNGHHAGEALRAIQRPDEPEHFGLWPITPPDGSKSQRRGKGRSPGRGLHCTQRPRGDGPGPVQERGGAARPHDGGRWKSSALDNCTWPMRIRKRNFYTSAERRRRP